MKEEVDLIDLVRKIVENGRKKWISLLIIVVFTGAVSTYLYKKQVKTYSTEAVIYFNYSEVGLQTYKQLFEILNKFANSNNYSALSEAMNISLKDASIIDSFIILPVENEELSIHLKLVVYNSTNLDKIEESILLLLNENTAISNLTSLKLTRFEKLISETNVEKNKVDSIWKNDELQGDVELSGLIEVSNTMEEAIIVNKYHLDRTEMGFSYIIPFNKNNLILENDPKLRNYILLTCLVSFLIWGAFLFLIEVKNLLKI